MKNIAILASGNGSNAENIIRFFHANRIGWQVSVVLCNRPEARVMQRAEHLGVPAELMSKDRFNDPAALLGVMDRYAVDAIVLAGFLLMVSPFLIARYPGRIINIHPSLLPKFGGRGMYGHHVHKAVVAAGERESGITVHEVSEQCDGGQILFQAATEVTPADTPADVEAKIHCLEQQYFPPVIAATLTGRPLSDFMSLPSASRA